MMKVTFDIDDLRTMEDETLRFIAAKILIEKARREQKLNYVERNITGC